MELSFELVRGEIGEGGVFSLGVVVGVDELEDFDLGVCGGVEAAALEHFVFEGADEGLGRGIVVGVGAGGHALAEASLGESVAEGGGAVLAAAVAVEDGVFCGAGLESLVKSVEDEIGAEVVGEFPAEDASGVEIDDDGEIEPTGGGGDEGDVAGPGLVGSGGRRLMEEEIGRRFIGAAVAGFGQEVFGLESAQAVLGHEAADSGVSTGQTAIGEDGAQAAVAIASAVEEKDGLDEAAEGVVGELGLGGLSGVVKAAAGQAESGADLANTGAGILGEQSDQGASGYWVLRPRMTAAFFKMSFSSLR